MRSSTPRRKQVACVLRGRRNGDDRIIHGPFVRQWLGKHPYHERGEYKNGEFHGTWHMVYPDGSKGKVEHHEGEFHGESVNWHANGQIRTRDRFHHGKPVGVWMRWRESGKPEREVTYEAGQRVGTRQWHPNGVLASDCTPSGQCKRWNAAGVMKEDRGDGSWTLWHDNGNKRERRVERDGARTVRQWYESGQLAAERHWRGGMRDGEWTYWHENGAKKAAGKFTGHQQVEWSAWDEGGGVVPVHCQTVADCVVTRPPGCCPCGQVVIPRTRLPKSPPKYVPGTAARNACAAVACPGCAPHPPITAGCYEGRCVSAEVISRLP